MNVTCVWVLVGLGTLVLTGVGGYVVRRFKHRKTDDLGLLSIFRSLKEWLFKETSLENWTMACVAQWVFGQFEGMDPEVDANITIKDRAILGEAVNGIKAQNPNLGARLEGALLGREPKALSVFIANGECKEVYALQAREASVDEIGDNLLRMERYTHKIMTY